MKEYKFRINGKSYDVTINSIADGVADVSVNGTSYNVEMEGITSAAAPSPATKKTEAAPQAGPAAVRRETVPSSGRKIYSPLPGVIISVDVKEGQNVKRGEKIAVIEAMKMENEILAECDGVVTGIRVTKGDSVLEGATILTIA